MTVTSHVRSIAITSYFAHHASFNGYRQILSYTKPDAIFGIDERRSDTSDLWGKRYPCVHEWRAWRWHRNHPVDVVHVLYGEWYLYASPWLFGRTPVIATFHQPPEKLSRLLKHGPETGRVMHLVHRITQKRFSRLAAAIVLTQEQRQVLSKYMPEDRIHIIPLGTAANHLISAFQTITVQRQPSMILTVGEWLRDWDYYFECVRLCQKAYPSLSFVLVNRKLPARWHHEARSLSNLEWHDNASDETLLQCYARASVMFLPLLEATGNNSVNEAMAAGLPVVTTVPLAIQAPEAFCTVSTQGLDATLNAILKTAALSEDVRADLRRETQQNLALHDWSVTAARTMDVYSLAIRSSEKSRAAVR